VSENRKVYFKDELQAVLDSRREELYKSIPYVIENYAQYKLVPYIYSKDFLSLIDDAFKSLKELIHSYCSPFEEKEKGYDYGIALTPLMDGEADFLKSVCAYDNLLDKKCIERWFLSKGRQFNKSIRDVFINVSQESENKNAACYLFLLTLTAKFNEIEQDIVNQNIGKVSLERKDAYFSNFFFFLFDLLVNQFSQDIKRAEIKDALLLNFFSPLIFSQIKTSFFRNPFNFWNLGKNSWEMLEKADAYNKFSAEKRIPEDIMKNEKIFHECAKNAVWNDIRDEIYRFISVNYSNDEVGRRLAAVYYTPTLFFNFLKDHAYRSEVFAVKKSSIFSERKDIDSKYIEFRSRLESLLKMFNQRDPSDLFQRTFDSYVRFKNHESFMVYSREMLANVKDRRKDEGIDIKKEHEDGKLYYFSLEKNKLIMTPQGAETASIFIDIRDFAKKTFHLKEETIIEVLREKFYLPTLRYAGARKSAGDITLHNIVGDAIIFTGTIDEIIRLAVEVKKNSEDYKKGLEHLIYDEEKKDFMSLDLGIFITYGKVPDSSTITSDFGTHLISIGEIINESSRGAKRDGNAFRRMEYILASEGRKRKELVSFPFNVYIVEGYNIILPPTLEFDLLKLVDQKEKKEIIEGFFEQTKIEQLLESQVGGEIWSKQKFIYNIGIAMTQEAFSAFLKCEAVFSEIKNIKLDLRFIPEVLRKKFFFKDLMAEFVIVKNKNTRETFLFRKEGEISFRGIGRETEVWELITKDMEICEEVLKLSDSPKKQQTADDTRPTVTGKLDIF
jgi:hypothetical protein